MATIKRFSDNYTLRSINKTQNNTDPGATKIVLDTNLVDVTGDLRVSGTATFIQRQDVSISDNIIVLNDGETAAGVSTDFSGIEINRGSLPKADLLFDEINDEWTVDLGDGVRRTILTTTPNLGNPLYNVVEDTTPQLGGNLDVNGFNITSINGNDINLTADSTGQVRINSPLVLTQSPPTTVATNEVALFEGGDTGGGTGVHFQNDTTSGELVSKKKALAYSIIF